METADVETASDSSWNSTNNNSLYYEEFTDQDSFNSTNEVCYTDKILLSFFDFQHFY